MVTSTDKEVLSRVIGNTVLWRRIVFYIKQLHNGKNTMKFDGDKKWDTSKVKWVLTNGHTGLFLDKYKKYGVDRDVKNGQWRFYTRDETVPPLTRYMVDLYLKNVKCMSQFIQLYQLYKENLERQLTAGQGTFSYLLENSNHMEAFNIVKFITLYIGMDVMVSDDCLDYCAKVGNYQLLMFLHQDMGLETNHFDTLYYACQLPTSSGNTEGRNQTLKYILDHGLYNKKEVNYVRLAKSLGTSGNLTSLKQILNHEYLKDGINHYNAMSVLLLEAIKKGRHRIVEYIHNNYIPPRPLYDLQEPQEKYNIWIQPNLLNSAIESGSLETVQFLIENRYKCIATEMSRLYLASIVMSGCSLEILKYLHKLNVFEGSRCDSYYWESAYHRKCIPQINYLILHGFIDINGCIKYAANNNIVFKDNQFEVPNT